MAISIHKLPDNFRSETHNQVDGCEENNGFISYISTLFASRVSDIEQSDYVISDKMGIVDVQRVQQIIDEISNNGSLKDVNDYQFIFALYKDEMLSEYASLVIASLSEEIKFRYDK